jgi:hypothetical protein
LFRAVGAEAGGCSRPRRHGGSPAHVGAAAAAPRGGGGPRSPRDHPRPWQPRVEERCQHKAVPPRVGPCLSSVAPPRRQGELRSFPAIRHPRRGRGRGAVLSHVATQVPAAHSHGDRQARAGPGRTALGVSDGEGMRVARPRRAAPGYSHWGRAPAGEGEGESEW